MGSNVQIIKEAPFVKAVTSDDRRVHWWFVAKDPATNRTVSTFLSPYALMKSLGKEHGEEELLTCGCGVAGCAGFSDERFERTEAYVHWSFEEMGTAYSLFFERRAYEVGAIEMLHEVYTSKEGWQFNGTEYWSYEEFKSEVDKFLAVKPYFKAIWDELEEKA